MRGGEDAISRSAVELGGGGGGGRVRMCVEGCNKSGRERGSRGGDRVELLWCCSFNFTRLSSKRRLWSFSLSFPPIPLLSIMFHANATNPMEPPLACSQQTSKMMDASLHKFQSSLSRIYDKYDRPFLDCETEIVDLSTLTILKGNSRRGAKRTGIIAGIQEDRELGEEIIVDAQAANHAEQYEAESGGSDSSFGSDSDSDSTDLDTESFDRETKIRIKTKPQENDVSFALLNKMRNIKRVLLKSKDQTLGLKSELFRGLAASQSSLAPHEVGQCTAESSSPSDHTTLPANERSIPMIRIKRPRQKQKVEPPKRPRGRPRKVVDPLQTPVPKKTRRRRRKAKDMESHPLTTSSTSIQIKPPVPPSSLLTSTSSPPSLFMPNFDDTACMLTPEPSSCSSEHGSYGLPPILLEIVKEDPALLSLYHSLLSSPHYKELSRPSINKGIL